jgi:hypothetical protein
MAPPISWGAIRGQSTPDSKLAAFKKEIAIRGTRLPAKGPLSSAAAYEKSLRKSLKHQIPNQVYVDSVPVDLPDGYVLVHNFPPGDPQRPLGSDGFRAWLTPRHADDVQCDCGWSPVHYRTAIKH